MLGDLLTIAWLYLRLSLQAFGGGLSILPAMRDATVVTHGWLTDEQFRDSFALGQLTPGPGMLMVTVAGYRAAGVAGALVAVVAMFLPTSLLTYAVGRSWTRLKDASWRPAVQGALAPISVGLMAAGTYTLMRSSIQGPVTAVMVVGACLVAMRWRLPPILIVAAGALGGIALLR